jgi:hypothetical protein
MSLRSAAFGLAAKNMTTLNVCICEKLQKKLLALKTKLPALVLLKGQISIADSLPVMRTLIAQWNNKKLTNSERKALEEYKHIIMNSFRDKISQSAFFPFKVEKTLRNKLSSAGFKKQFPGFSLLEESAAYATLAQLSQEFALIKTHLKRKNLTKLQKVTLKQYRNLILASSLYKQSGLSETHRETVLNESKGKTLLQRSSFVLPQVLQIISNGCLYLVELLGKSSLINFIPNIANPIALGVSALLIGVTSVMDFAFGMKLFKDTYGIAFFGQISKSNLSLCEKQFATTKYINQMLAEPISCLALDSATYSSYSEFAVLLNKNITAKVSKEKSEFSKHTERRWLKVARWGLLGFSSLLSINSSYFAGASLFTLATGATLLTPAGWVLVAALIVSSLGLLYLQQAKSTFGLLNPTFERFEKLQKAGLKLTANLEKTKATFEFNLQQKIEDERKALPTLTPQDQVVNEHLPALQGRIRFFTGTTGIELGTHIPTWLHFRKNHKEQPAPTPRVSELPEASQTVELRK